MSSATITVDSDAVVTTFRQWQADQTALDAQLVESVAALEAYQSHLDAWQKDLARERDELRQLREATERKQTAAGVDEAQLEHAATELAEARQKITTLTTALLARTEELRELDRQRAESHTEVAVARAREKELTVALAEQHQVWQADRQRWEKELSQLREQIERSFEMAPPEPKSQASEPTRPVQPVPETPTSANAVLGSVMEQFGKLRQQRSMGRPNHPKPR